MIESHGYQAPPQSRCLAVILRTARLAEPPSQPTNESRLGLDLSGRSRRMAYRAATRIPIFFGGNWGSTPDAPTRLIPCTDESCPDILWSAPVLNHKGRTVVVILPERILESAISDSAIKLGRHSSAHRMEGDW